MRVKHFSLIVLIALMFMLLNPAPSAADEAGPGKSKTSMTAEYLGAISLLEAFIALNSLFAAYEPMAYGIMGSIVSPLTFAGASSPFTAASGFFLYLGLCSWNIAYPLENDVSEKELFWGNMAGWHIMIAGLGAVYLIEYIFSDKKNEPSM